MYSIRLDNQLCLIFFFKKKDKTLCSASSDDAMVSFQDMLLHATGPSLMRFPLFGIVTSLVKTSLVALSQVSLLSNILEYGSSFIIIGMIV